MGTQCKNRKTENRQFMKDEVEEVEKSNEE